MIQLVQDDGDDDDDGDYGQAPASSGFSILSRVVNLKVEQSSTLGYSLGPDPDRQGSRECGWVSFKLPEISESV